MSQELAAGLFFAAVTYLVCRLINWSIKNGMLMPMFFAFVTIVLIIGAMARFGGAF